MTVIFEVVSKIGKEVRLTDVQWTHMKARHKELRNQIGKMRLVLTEPDSIWHSPREEVYHFYRRFTKTPVSEKYLLLVVKYVDDEGFVVTGFFVSRIRKRGRVLVYGKEDSDSL